MMKKKKKKKKLCLTNKESDAKADESLTIECCVCTTVGKTMESLLCLHLLVLLVSPSNLPNVIIWKKKLQTKVWTEISAKMPTKEMTHSFKHHLHSIMMPLSCRMYFDTESTFLMTNSCTTKPTKCRHL